LHDKLHSQLKSLFCDGLPLLDVRAPVEFARGAFPTSSNIPLLSDAERHRVGLLYKRSGQEEAVALGHKLVSGALKESRINAWKTWCQNNPTGWLYCFRGGLRSQISQAWLAAEDIHCPRVPGGYKAMRQFLIDTIQLTSDTHRFTIIAGPTGSGKTHLLQQLGCAVDLEQHAAHRGSAFGSLMGKQPSQISFENAIAIDFLRLAHEADRSIFLEDESQSIGSLSIPHMLYLRMKAAPIAVIEESIETRTATILDDYIKDNYEQFRRADPDHAFEQFSSYLLSSLERIQRRLGGDSYNSVRNKMLQALSLQKQCGDTAAHSLWIGQLLHDYYDPMYAYQLSKKMDRVIFRGPSEAFLNWARP
jgi:tRNA 2-selenouridine synthase